VSQLRLSHTAIFVSPFGNKGFLAQIFASCSFCAGGHRNIAMTSFLFAVAVASFGVCHATVHYEQSGNLGTGIFTIQQQSTMRYVDADQLEPFNVITSVSQENIPSQKFTQRWFIKKIKKDSYTIQQVSTMRYVDADQGVPFHVITRESQENIPGQKFTQRWVIKFDKVERSYTIRQQSTMRYVDADQGVPFHVITNENQEFIPGQKLTQRWIIKADSKSTSGSAIRKALRKAPRFIPTNELIEVGWSSTLGWSAACGVVGVLAGATAMSVALRTQRQSSDATRFALMVDA